MAWGGYEENDYLYQDIAIPIGTTSLSLSLYRNFQTAEPSGDDWDQVIVSFNLSTIWIWGNQDSTSGWVNENVIIPGDYSGTTV